VEDNFSMTDPDRAHEADASSSDEPGQAKLAKDLALIISETSRPVLRGWLEELLQLRSSNISKLSKARRAIAVTCSSRVLLPLIKTVAVAVKRHGWDKRRSSSRFGIVGAVVGVAVFGGQSAGIAALGTAIGVPLWVVLGAGAFFASTLLDELRRTDAQPRRTDRSIVEATPDEDGVYRLD
jgi:hypothetical protein